MKTEIYKKVYRIAFKEGDNRKIIKIFAISKIAAAGIVRTLYRRAHDIFVMGEL